MLLGTGLDMMRCMNIEAAEKLLDNDDSKIIEKPAYSVVSDDAISDELSNLAQAIKDTDGNSKDAKENLEARRVKFFDKYFFTYHSKNVECFVGWNIQPQYVSEITGFLGYTKKQIPQMVKFFSPLFDKVRETSPVSLGMPITTQSEKLWRKSGELAIKYNTETATVFKAGIMNLSLFCTGGKLKDEDWAEVQASWNIDYWESPDWKKLQSLKGKSISREVVDNYMVMSEADRQAELEEMKKAEKEAARHAFGLLSIQEKFDEIVFPVGPDKKIHPTQIQLVVKRFGDIVIESLTNDNKIKIISSIDIDIDDEKQLKNLKKEMSAVLENVIEHLASITDEKKKEMLFKKFTELESSGNLEKRLALSDEQLAALEAV